MLSESKIRIMKAIHNCITFGTIYVVVVLSESKIRIMKAIHNFRDAQQSPNEVVLSESKIRIMKAIHNLISRTMNTRRLCSVSQR